MSFLRRLVPLPKYQAALFAIPNVALVIGVYVPLMLGGNPLPSHTALDWVVDGILPVEFLAAFLAFVVPQLLIGVLRK